MSQNAESRLFAHDIPHFIQNSNKAQTHFPRIRKLTGISYDKMLFFDDW